MGMRKNRAVLVEYIVIAVAIAAAIVAAIVLFGKSIERKTQVAAGGTPAGQTQTAARPGAPADAGKSE